MRQLIAILLLSISLHSSETFSLQTSITEQSLSTSSTDHCLLVAPDATINSSQDIEEMKLSISKNYISGEDSLVYNTPISPIVGSWDTAKGILTLSGLASPEKYQEAIRGVKYCNDGNPPTVAERNINIYISNGKYFNPENGHYYEKRCMGSSIRWTEAQPLSETYDFFGMEGYLSTITEDSENSFIQEKVGGDYAWIGTTDVEVEGVWRWKTGPEGLEDGGKGRHFFTQTKHNRTQCPCSSNISLMPTDSCQTYTDSSGIPLISGDGGGDIINGEYHFWRNNEPNSWKCDEDYGHFYINREWNDYKDSNNVKCFIVEYGGMPTDPDSSIDNLNLKTEIKVNVVADSISSELDYICAFSSAVSVFDSSEWVDLGGGQCNTRIIYTDTGDDAGLNVADLNIREPVDCQKICNETSCDSSNEFAVPIDLPPFPTNSSNDKEQCMNSNCIYKSSEQNMYDTIQIFNDASVRFVQDSNQPFVIDTLKLQSGNMKQMVFEPGTYFIEDFQHFSGSDIVVDGVGDGSGTVRFLIRGEIQFNSNSYINFDRGSQPEDNEPSKLMFIAYDGGNIDIASGVYMSAMLYTKVPEVKSADIYSGEVFIHSNSTLNGAITANHIQIEDQVYIYSKDLTPPRCDSYSAGSIAIQFIFDVRDIGIVSDTNFSITTKVTNREFGLQVVAFDENRVRKSFSGAVSLKTVQPNEISLGSCTFSGSEICNTDGNLTIPIAIKESRVIITESGKEFNSSDNFAVRPKRFYIDSISSPQKADINFTLTIDVRDEVDTVTGYQYSEAISDLNLSTTQKKSCIDENLSGLDGGSFFNGVLSKSVNYPEVGEVKIEIREKVGSEYAVVDRNDTNLIDRLIEPDDINITFDISRYRVTGELVDFYIDKNFTYYSSDLEMSAKLSLLFESLGGDGNITLNYDADCYERNLTKFSIEFDWNRTINRNLIGNSEFNISNNILDIENISFQNGTNSTTLTLNLDRNISFPKNSDTLYYIDSNEDFGTYLTDKNISGEAHFYYGRIQSPNYRFKGRDGNYTLYSEIWTDLENIDNSTFGERFIDIHWYENKKIPISNLYKEVPNLKKITVNSSTKTLSYETGYFPYRQIMEINTSSWLIYNRFIESADKNYFTVEFHCDEKLPECEEKSVESISKRVDIQESAKYKDRRIEW